MRCPYCVEEGERSRVYTGGTYRTLMGGAHWDENGNWWDPNTSSTSYSCSRGHAWKVEQGPRGEFVSQVRELGG